MKRKQLLLAIAAMLLPMSMVAQTNQTDPYTGLNYLDDGDGKWYITANNTTYFYDPDLRPFWRRAFNNNVTKFYKDDLNGVKVIGLSHTWSGGTATAPNGNSGRQMVFGGIAYFQGLEDLTIKSGSAQSVVLDLSKNESLKSLTFDQSTIKLQTLNISNTQLTSLTIPTGSASMLESLTMGNVPSLTSLTFGGSSDFTKLESLDVSETGLTSLDLSLCTALKTLKIDKTNLTVGDNLTLPTPSDWILKRTVGNVETWIRAANITTLTVDAAEEGTTDIDVSAYPKLHTLTVTGATRVTLPDNTTNPTDSFTLIMTDCPNATIEWNGRENKLKKLNLTNVATFNGTGPTDSQTFTELQRMYCYNALTLDVSSCTKLKFLEVKGPSDTDLILSKDNTDLLILDVSRSGMTKLDLSGESGTGSGSKPALSLAPNLKLVACCWTPIETLDLRNHTKLEYIALKSQSGENNSITGFTPHRSPIEPDYSMKAFIDSCTNKSYFDVEYEHNSGSYRGASDKNENGYGVDGGDNSKHKTYYNAGNKLREVNIEGCGMLKQLLVTGLWTNNKKYEYTQIEKIDAFRCAKLQEIVAINGRLSTLRVRTCPMLEYLAIEQNYLDESSFAGDNGLINVQNLRKFIAHRNRFTNLDFLTMPVSGRGAEHIAKLQQIQVNGGSYVIRDLDDNYISHLLDGDGEKGASPGKRNHKFTSTLKRFNTENLGADMRILYCGDNMLEELNLSTMPNLRKLECKNNMLLTLDLSKLRDPDKLIWDPGEKEGDAGKRAYKVEDASWGNQVAFLNVEVVKGKITLKKKKNEEGEDVYDEKGEPVYVVDTNDPGIKGLNDLVALHMPNGGYRHNLKGDGGAVELYPSLADELAETNKIASEYNTHMCFIENHDNTLCPTGHSGIHLFLHTGQEIVNENSDKPKDQDLYGGVLNYKYDTQVLCDSAGYSRATPPTEEQCKSGAGTWEWEDASHGGSSGYPVLRGTGYDVFTWKKNPDTGIYGYEKAETVDKYVNARVHVYPYIMYVNPATRSTYQKLGVKDSVDYYSGTIYLDYAAIVPEGLEVYVAAGLARKTVEEEEVLDTTLITSNGISEAHEQLRMVKVGVAGEIIPARTPLYVKPALPSAEKQANGWSQAAAGLYAFETTWDFKLLGWEDYRGCPGAPSDTPILHGPDVDNYNPETMVWRDGCDPTKNPSRWINNKEIVLEKPLDGKNTYTGQELLDKNILSGTLEDIDLTSSTSNSLGLTRRSVLVLGLESQKGTNMIGFWPQNAKKIGAHRCYITYDDAMEKLGGVPGVSVPATSVSGFKFSFADEDSFSEDVGDANGDGVVSIADVTAIINKINGVVTGKFVEKAADVNKDGIISIADVTGVINTINNQ